MSAVAIPGPRRLLAAAWMGLALAATVVLILLVQFWGARPEYADRFLILLGAGWVAWANRRTTPTGRPQIGFAIPLALFAGVSIPAAAFLQTQAAGGRTVLLWLDTVALLLGAASLLLAEGGWPRLRHFAFPLIFPFFALPLPSRILGPLQNLLQEATTSIAARVLPLIGLPVRRLESGFVLKLAAGDLSVAEECSGVQSLTALTALAAFVAHRSGFGPGRGTALTLIAVPVVVIVNAIRVVLSGLIQEWAGPHYIRGEWHDALGFALILVGLAGIVGMGRALGRPAPVVPRPVSDHSTSAPRWASIAIAVFLLGGLAGGVLTYSLGSSRESAVVQNAPLERLPMTLGDWRGQDRPVDDSITALLGQDRILHRVYENNLGQSISVFAIYWSSAKLVKGYHHPDVCLGNQGFRVISQRIEILRPRDSGPIPTTAREFERDGSSQFVLYWTQEGNRIWDESDELVAQKETGFLTRPEWFDDALSGRMTQPTGRLVVLIGTGGNTPLDRREATEFARRLAEEIHSLCPWAKP